MIMDLKVWLTQTIDKVKVKAERLEGGHSWARAYKARLGVTKADLEVVRAAPDEFCMKAHLAKEAKATTEAKCSLAQAKISRVFLKMEEKFCASIAGAMREVEEVFARRVKEA